MWANSIAKPPREGASSFDDNDVRNASEAGARGGYSGLPPEFLAAPLAVMEG